MSFTDFYFNFGYNSALEKVAKDEESMSTAKKLGLGALGAGVLGAGAYFGGDALKDLGAMAAENVKAIPMEGAGDMTNQALAKVAPMLSGAGDSMNAARDAILQAAQNKALDVRDAAAALIGKPVPGSIQDLTQGLDGNMPSGPTIPMAQ